MDLRRALPAAVLWALFVAALLPIADAGFIPADATGGDETDETLLRAVNVLADPVVRFEQVKTVLRAVNTFADPDRRSDRVQPAVRAVNDVAPAVKNATVLALAEAQGILEQYSNGLRIASIPGGIVVTFLGTFLLTPVLFTAGFLSGGGTAFVATKALIGAETPAAAWASILAMLVVGVLAGLLTMKMLSVGVFAVGAMLGVALASAATPGVLGRIYPANTAVGFYVGAIVFGCAFGALAMRFQKQMVIVATAYGGAFAFFFGIGYFAGHFPSAADLTRAQQGLLTTWLVIYSLFTMLIGTTGAFTQFRLAGARPLVHAGRVNEEEAATRWWRKGPGPEPSPSETEGLAENEQGETAIYKIAPEIEATAPPYNLAPELEELSNASEGSAGKVAKFAYSASDSGLKMETGDGEFENQDAALSKSLSPQMFDSKSDFPAVEFQKPKA